MRKTAIEKCRGCMNHAPWQADACREFRTVCLPPPVCRFPSNFRSPFLRCPQSRRNVRRERTAKWVAGIVRMKVKVLASDGGSAVVDVGSSRLAASPLVTDRLADIALSAPGRGFSSRIRSLYSLSLEGAHPCLTALVRIGCTGAVRPTSPPTNAFPRLSNEGLTTCQDGEK